MCDALNNLVLFAQFKKREKHSFKNNTPPWVFFTFFKLQKYQLAQSIEYTLTSKLQLLSSECHIYLTYYVCCTNSVRVAFDNISNVRESPGPIR